MSAAVQPTQDAIAVKPEVGFKLTDLPRCGRYTTYLALVYFIMVLTQVCNLLYMTFAEGNRSLADRKPQTLDFCAENYPQYAKNCSGQTCWVTINGSSVICTKKYYDFIPITNDFDVPSAQVKVGTMLQNIGLMVGAILFGNLADTYGRKLILLSATAGLLIFQMATSFAPSFILFTALRFFDMVFTGGKHCVCNPYFMENLPDKHRMWVATVVTYSPNYIILAGIAWLCYEWRILARVAAGLTVLPLIMLFFLKDTPRWLIAKGKTERAVRSVVYIKNWDEEVTPEMQTEVAVVVEKACKAEAEKQKTKTNYYFWHLFKNRSLASYAIVFATSLFSTSFISYGIAYNLDAIAGNVYVNVIIIGLARYAINISAAILEFSVKSVGRRALHLSAVAFIALTMGIIFLIYVFMWPQIVEYKIAARGGGIGDASMRIVVVATSYAALIASAMCTEVFVLDAVQPAELFPTPIRSTGIAFIQIFNRLGTIVSPLVFIPSKNWPPAPFLLMFITSSADLILYLLLIPETRGRKLPDKMPWEEAPDSEKVADKAASTPIEVSASPASKSFTGSTRD